MRSVTWEQFISAVYDIAVHLNAGNTTVRVQENAVASIGSINISVNPADGDYIQIPDSISNAVTFEFDVGGHSLGTVIIGVGRAQYGDTVTLHGSTFEFTDGQGVSVQGNVEVDISQAVTNENDANALGGIISGVLNINPSVTNDGTDFLLNLAWRDGGPAGDGVIAVSGANLGKTDMTGGTLPELNNPADVAVLIGASPEATMVTLIDAINVSPGFNVTAYPTNPANATCTQVHKVPGSDGNNQISVSGTFTVSGMSGGRDTVTLGTLYDMLADILASVSTP